MHISRHGNVNHSHIKGGKVWLYCQKEIHRIIIFPAAYRREPIKYKKSYNISGERPSNDTHKNTVYNSICRTVCPPKHVRPSSQNARLHYQCSSEGKYYPDNHHPLQEARYQAKAEQRRSHRPEHGICKVCGRSSRGRGPSRGRPVLDNCLRDLRRSKGRHRLGRRGRVAPPACSALGIPVRLVILDRVQ